MQLMDMPDKMFIKKHALATETLDSCHVQKLNFLCDAFIVGSDSLWGGGYEYQIYALEGILFGSKISDGKKILSFSTSFVSWKGTGSMLLKRFSHISVRKRSGIAICAEEFGVNASWTLDPW